MFTVSTKEEARNAYIIMRKFGRIAGCESLIEEVKRALRQYAKHNSHIVEADGYTYEHRLTRDYGDGFVELVTMPDSIHDKQDANDFFDAYIKRECVWTPYDCSGQLFTAWHHIFKRNGRWCVYHCVACDC